MDDKTWKKIALEAKESSPMLTTVHQPAYGLQIVHSGKMLIVLPPGEHTVVVIPFHGRIVQPMTYIKFEVGAKNPLTAKHISHQHLIRTSYEVSKSCIALLEII